MTDTSSTTPPASSKKSNAVSNTVLVIVWWVLAPLLFILLYSVIETHAAARAAVGSSSRIAPFTISNAAKDIRAIEKQLKDKEDELARLVREQTKATSAYEEASIKAEMALSTLTSNFAVDRDPAVPLCGEDDLLDECLAKLIPIARNSPWAEDDAVQNEIEAASSAIVQYRVTVNASDRFDMSVNALRLGIAGLRAKLEGKAVSYNAYTGHVIPADSVTNVQSAPATPNAAEDEDRRDAGADDTAGPVVGTDSVRAVALSYNRQRELLPPFESLFLLPPGVIVAFFTALMGALGAAVFSLLGDLKTLEQARASSWQRYGVTPVLGALAGFTVYFVVAAGATFLIQPGSVEATGAVNQLSPAALASLGIFAGLAAPQAMEWLVEKARTAFQTNANDQKQPSPQPPSQDQTPAS